MSLKDPPHKGTLPNRMGWRTDRVGTSLCRRATHRDPRLTCSGESPGTSETRDSPAQATHATSRSLAAITAKTKTLVTCDSRVVPHRSTEQAQRCLVSEIGRDRTFSPWYEPTMGMDQALGSERLVGDPAYLKSKAQSKVV